MKSILSSLAGVFAIVCLAQAQQTIRYSATTGDVSITSGTAATVQQPATNGTDVLIEQIVVYCSVNCSVTQAANGTAATSTAGSISPLLPAPTNNNAAATFWTSSNVGSGTAQGGITHIPGGATAILCLARSCGNGGDILIGYGAGTTSNYTLTIAAAGSGTGNITFYLRSGQ